jgi:hypothetical protein
MVGLGHLPQRNRVHHCHPDPTAPLHLAASDGGAGHRSRAQRGCVRVGVYEAVSLVGDWRKKGRQMVLSGLGPRGSASCLRVGPHRRLRRATGAASEAAPSCTRRGDGGVSQGGVRAPARSWYRVRSAA